MSSWTLANRLVGEYGKVYCGAVLGSFPGWAKKRHLASHRAAPSPSRQNISSRQQRHIMPPKRPLKKLAEERSDNEDDIVIEEPQLAADDPMRAFLPTSFGKQTGMKNTAKHEQTKRQTLQTKEKRKSRSPEPKSAKEKEKSEERERSESPGFGPAWAPQGGNESGSDSGSGFEESDEEEQDEEYPISHELVIKGHSKAISSISVDTAGGRFITGSHDCNIKFYDFHSMSSNALYAFRSVEPSSSHHIHHASFSPMDNGQSVLALSASSQAKLYSRDGEEQLEFVKGDMYLRDLNNTKGHISEITCGVWHPTQKWIFATGATDSTVRIWDINNHRTQQSVIVHKSKTAKGGRSRITSLTWAGAVGEGAKNMIAATALDGSLLLWGGNGPFTRPAVEVRNAHAADTWTSSLVFSGDGRLLVTKGGPGDDTIKLWDTRKLKTPVNTRSGFPMSPQQESNIIFSPDSSNLLLGDNTGKLHILSAATLVSEKSIPICNSAIVTVNWSSKINQILLGNANGDTHILYSPETSIKGANIVVANAPKRRHFDEDPSLTTDISTAAMSGDTVILPNGILGAPGEKSRKRNDPLKPQMPPVTPWGKSQPDPEHIKKSVALSAMRDEDPREALLKYAEKAKNDPMFTRAYAETQPVAIFAERNVEELEEEEKEREKKRQRR